jgi:hypothetical protein
MNFSSRKSRLFSREVVRILHHPPETNSHAFQILPLIEATTTTITTRHAPRILVRRFGNNGENVSAPTDREREEYDSILFLLEGIDYPDNVCYVHQLGQDLYQCDAMVGILGQDEKKRYSYWDGISAFDSSFIGSICIRMDVIMPSSFFVTILDHFAPILCFLRKEKRYVCACSLGLVAPTAKAMPILSFYPIQYRMRSTILPRRGITIPSSDSVRVVPEENDFHHRHIHLHYLSPDTLLLTMTLFREPDSNDPLFIRVHVQGVSVILPLIPAEWRQCRKRSFCIRWATPCMKPCIIPNISRTIMQNFIGMDPDNNPSLSRNRFYSICTILGMLPWMPYEFFQTQRVQSYFQERCPELWPLYESLRVPAYRSDLFRATYICQNGGLYMDCKMVLFDPLLSLWTTRNEIFAKDAPDDYVCNGFLYTREANNLKMRRYLDAMCRNISNRKYGKDALSITGPGLLGKFVNRYTLQYHRHGEGGGWQDSYMRYLTTDQIVIKNSYYGYYQENNYGASEHYNVLWNEKRVFS